MWKYVEIHGITALLHWKLRPDLGSFIAKVDTRLALRLVDPFATTAIACKLYALVWFKVHIGLGLD